MPPGVTPYTLQQMLTTTLDGLSSLLTEGFSCSEKMNAIAHICEFADEGSGKEHLT